MTALILGSSGSLGEGGVSWTPQGLNASVALLLDGDGDSGESRFSDTFRSSIGWGPGMERYSAVTGEILCLCLLCCDSVVAVEDSGGILTS